MVYSSMHSVIQNIYSKTLIIWSTQDWKIELQTSNFKLPYFFNANLLVIRSAEVQVLRCKLWFFLLNSLKRGFPSCIIFKHIICNLIQFTSICRPANNNSRCQNLISVISLKKDSTVLCSRGAQSLEMMNLHANCPENTIQ